MRVRLPSWAHKSWQKISLVVISGRSSTGRVQRGGRGFDALRPVHRLRGRSSAREERRSDTAGPSLVRIQPPLRRSDGASRCPMSSVGESAWLTPREGWFETSIGYSSMKDAVSLGTGLHSVRPIHRSDSGPVATAGISSLLVMRSRVRVPPAPQRPCRWVSRRCRCRTPEPRVVPKIG